MNSPRFYIDKELSLRGMFHVGVIEADYTRINKIFGHPVIAEENGDIIDDLSSAIWPLQFEDGMRAEFSDNRELGSAIHDDKPDYDFRKCKQWKIRGTNHAVLGYIKELLSNASL